MGEVTPLLEVRGLVKTFGGQRALDEVDLSIGRGEVHGLLGENGSGKSTLIKVLSGFHEPDAGELAVGGVAVPLPMQAGQYRELGFEFVHQDLGLIASLNVTENLYLNDVARSRAASYSWRDARRRAAATFENYGVDIDPSALVEKIRPVQRAMLAIVRAVESIRRDDGTDDAKLLVLDEPTVFLPREEVGLLFRLVRRLTSQGSSVLFVSHDLDEVREITDRVTVLRDGRTSGTVTTSSASGRQLVEMIVGHELATFETPDAAPVENRDVVVSVEGLCTENLSEVSFEVRRGEVLGFTGLVGSGYEDVVYAMFGAVDGARGTVTIEGNQVDVTSLSPRRAVRAGMALVPADRKNDGSIATLSLAENINLTVLGRHFSRGRLRHGRLRENARRLVDEFDVRPSLPDLDYGSFSGGNQQKALMAKWQQIRPRVLLLHEPTQGVDVGARQQIFTMIRNGADGGATVCASSEYDQLETICDRVGVFVRGRLVAFLSGSAITKSRLADLCHAQAPPPPGEGDPAGPGLITTTSAETTR